MLEQPANAIYMKRFLRELHEKIRAKMSIMPHLINDEGYEKIKNFKQFDDRYTAPIHGFRDAEDYWYQCSSRRFLKYIQVPTLIVNALNDPFLSPSCYPVKEVKKNSNVVLEIPKDGGHVGFVEFNEASIYWSEKVAVKWFSY
ncbi:conserved hypothetical protein [Desulfamplus magnetovallimortis]|uniref:Uncharacterized protein n=2 Tax=Desulfamplus magnetovallimortis TaxID=1246637 RepID=A0A1W1HD97_9BACT|nr:conserved hypothetical protein [Desulfamplus magnetovallimortis]